MSRSFNEAYKAKRNQLRKYSLSSIAARVLEALHAESSDRVEALRAAPWHTLLLLKWACQDKMVSFQGAPEMSMEDMNNLRQQLWDMPGEIDHGITGDRPAYLFMRQLLRPQIDFQRRVTPGFVREAALLATQPENSRLRRIFLERTGLAVEAFVDLAFCTYAAVSQRKFISSSWFDPLRSSYGQYVDKFIDLVSADLKGLTVYFRSIPGSDQRVTSELFEFPLIKRYPLVRVNGGYAVWHPMVFFRGMEGMVHSIMSESGADYMKEFGGIFERHVVDQARTLSPDFWDEDGLRAMVPAGTKVADSLLSFPGVNVFIEAKAGIFNESVMVVGNKTFLKSKTEMLWKAVSQARLASDGLRKASIAPPQVLDAKEEFLLVVTNKELSAGRADRLLKMYGGEEGIEDPVNASPPLSNIYFISIEDYERLVCAADELDGGIVGFLRNCVLQDEDPRTQVFYFSQHLDAAGVPLDRSDMVKRAIEHADARLKGLLLGNQSLLE